MLAEEALPAVTYPQPGGPGWDDLTALLAPLATASDLVGMTVVDLRPDLDADERSVQRVVDLLASFTG